MPVWHASASPLGGLPTRLKSLKALSLGALRGVGDSAHEWHDGTPRAYHVRRRLSPEEVAVVGAAVDLRGTQEAIDRLSAWCGACVLPVSLRQMAVDEICLPCTGVTT